MLYFSVSSSTFYVPSVTPTACVHDLMPVSLSPSHHLSILFFPFSLSEEADRELTCVPSHVVCINNNYPLQPSTHFLTHFSHWLSNFVTAAVGLGKFFLIFSLQLSFYSSHFQIIMEGHFVLLLSLPQCILHTTHNLRCALHPPWGVFNTINMHVIFKQWDLTMPFLPSIC